MTPHDAETVAALRKRFADLHTAGIFVLPNAWDIGSVRILANLGSPAIATTSSGHTAQLGRTDQQVPLDELVDHVEALVQAVDLPVSVDAERCFADTPAQVAGTVERLAGTGAAGLSIEDYLPGSGIDPMPVAVDPVAAAADVARAAGMVLTARAENHLYGIDDLDDTAVVLLTALDGRRDLAELLIERALRGDH